MIRLARQREWGVALLLALSIAGVGIVNPAAFADLAAVIGRRLVELALVVRHAADPGHVELEGRLVAREPVGHELPFLRLTTVLSEEAPHVLAAARPGGVEHRRLHRVEGRRA